MEIKHEVESRFLVGAPAVRPPCHLNHTPRAAAERKTAEDRMRAGETAYSVARDMGIPYTTVRQWRVAMVEREAEGPGAALRHMPDTVAFARDVTARIAERAARTEYEDEIYLRRRSCVVPFPGDPPPGRSALDMRRAEDDRAA